jgi:hypothetical protein
MFRALIVLIALAVPGAQDASLLCQTWCSRQAEASTTCQHQQDSATRVLNARSCDSTSLETTLVPARGQRASGSASDLLTPLPARVSSLHREEASVKSTASLPAIPAFTRHTVLRI